MEAGFSAKAILDGRNNPMINFDDSVKNKLELGSEELSIPEGKDLFVQNPAGTVGAPGGDCANPNSYVMEQPKNNTSNQEDK